MQDPEFEKKVRMKMEELKFSPSESVWLQVEKQIQADRRRRKPLLWIFILSGLFLLGGSFFLIRHSSKSANGIASKSDQLMESRERKDTKPIHSPKDSGLSVAGDLANKQAQSSENTRSLQSGGKTKILFKEKNKATSFAASKSNHKNSKIVSQNQVADLMPESENQYDKRSEGSPGQNPTALILPSQAAKSANDLQSQVEKQNGDSAQEKPAPTSTSQISAKHPWAIGFSLCPGISSMKYDLPQYGYSQALYNPVTSSANPGVSSNVTSKAGFSFGAGIWLQKNLSNNIYLSLGLNYHYYSNTVTLTTASAYSALNKETSHADQFHFIELPVGLGFRLSSNNKFPLFAELGFTLSQMLSTNAGQFNALTGNYISESVQFRRFQFMIHAGLMVDISSRNHALFIGPVVQYGPQNLLTQGGGNAEHLFFTGLRFNYSLKK
jgi:Outer membrane protein beta-barrel domain